MLHNFHFLTEYRALTDELPGGIEKDLDKFVIGALSLANSSEDLKEVFEMACHEKNKMMGGKHGSLNDLFDRLSNFPVDLRYCTTGA